MMAVIQQLYPLSSRIEYRLVGSAAAVLRGAAFPAADIDILMKTRADLDTFAERMSAFRCLDAPAWLAESKQYYANYLVNGAEVGFSTVEIETDKDWFETYGPGPWRHFSYVTASVFRVPAAALELHLITELHRGNTARCDAIIKVLNRNGCDIALLGRGMAAIKVPLARQQDILRRVQEEA